MSSTPKPARSFKLPDVLSKPLKPFTGLRGASPFAVAVEHATKEQVDRARNLMGGLDATTFVRHYKATGNRIWLWMALAVSKDGAVPAEVMAYLRSCANEVFNEVVAQTKELERVKIVEGRPPEEGILRQPQRYRKVADIAGLLQLSHTGRNAIQEAAKDFRSVSMAVAAEDLVRNKGYTLNKAYALLATVNGRGSVAAGPAVGTMRKIVDRGRRLIGLLPTSGKPANSVSMP